MLFSTPLPEAMQMVDEIASALQEPPPPINGHLEQPPAIDCLARYLVALFLPVRDVLRAPSALRADAECGGAASRNQGPNAP